MTGKFFKNLSLWIGGGLAATGIAYYAVQNSKPSTAPAISIDTKDAVTRTMRVKTNLIDLSFTGKPTAGKEVNLQDAAFLRAQANLGFDGGVVHGYGANSDKVHYNSTARAYGNIPNDFPTYQDYLDYAGGLNTVLTWNNFTTKIKGFVDAVPMKCDVVLNVHNGFWVEHSYIQTLFQPEFAGYQSECVTTDMTIDQYNAQVAWMVDSAKKYFPNTKRIADCGRVDRENPKTTEWNQKLYAVCADLFHAGRFYSQVSDQEIFTANQDSNFIRVNHYIDSLFGQQVTKFKTIFPKWKISIQEFMPEDNRSNTKYITEKPAGVYCYARQYEIFLKNQDIVDHAVQMSNKPVVTDTNSIYYKELRALNKLTKTKNITKIVFTDKLYGISFSDGAGNNTILINNGTSSTYSYPNITFDGKKRSPVYSVERFYPDNGKADGNEKYEAVSSQGTLDIKPYSVTIANFTSK